MYLFLPHRFQSHEGAPRPTCAADSASEDSLEGEQEILAESQRRGGPRQTSDLVHTRDPWPLRKRSMRATRRSGTEFLHKNMIVALERRGRLDAAITPESGDNHLRWLFTWAVYEGSTLTAIGLAVKVGGQHRLQGCLSAPPRPRTGEDPSDTSDSHGRFTRLEGGHVHPATDRTTLMPSPAVPNRLQPACRQKLHSWATGPQGQNPNWAVVLMLDTNQINGYDHVAPITRTL